jgi:hypothetical protein
MLKIENYVISLENISRLGTYRFNVTVLQIYSVFVYLFKFKNKKHNIVHI